ncbi:unnamed protein product, partial [Prorocentrum cordatum]
ARRAAAPGRRCRAARRVPHIARCAADGQRLDMFRLCPRRGHLDTVEASKVVARGPTEATAMEWFPLVHGQERLLCLGFSHGGVSLLSQRGAVVLSFLLLAQPVLRARLGAESGGPPPAHEGGLLLLLHGGSAVAAVQLQSLRQAILAEGCCEGSIRFEVLELQGRAATVDVCLVERARPLEEAFEAGSTQALVALGSGPFLSLHRVHLDGQASARARLGNAAASTLGSLARAVAGLRGGRSGARAAPSQAPAGALHPQDIQVKGGARACLPAAAQFLDPTRAGDTLWPAPCCGAGPGSASPLAAACDSFGRVGLLCLETLRCLRLWKGYREAQVAWLAGGPGIPAAGGGHLGLVIYAPRRGLLELWDVADPAAAQRVGAAVVSTDGRLLGLGGQVFFLGADGRVDAVEWGRPPREGGAPGARDAALGGPPAPGAARQPAPPAEVPDRPQPDPAQDAAAEAADATGAWLSTPGPGEPSALEALLGWLCDGTAPIAAGRAPPADPPPPEDVLSLLLARWQQQDKVLDLLRRLDSAVLVAEGLAELLRAHSSLNRRLLRAVADGALAEDTALAAPSRTAAAAVGWVLDSRPCTEASRQWLAGRREALGLYAELLETALRPAPAEADVTWEATAVGRALALQEAHLCGLGADLAAPGGDDAVLAYSEWLARQPDLGGGTEDLARQVRAALRLYAPPPSAVPPPARAREPPRLRLAFDEFAEGGAPGATAHFACQSLLLSPRGGALVALVARVLRWPLLSEGCSGDGRPPWDEAHDELPASVGDDGGRALAERALQWLCGVPLPVLLRAELPRDAPPPGHRLGRALGDSLLEVFSEHPDVLRCAVSCAPPRLLPQLTLLCHMMAMSEELRSQQAGSVSGNIAGSLGAQLWAPLAAQSCVWLRYTCAAAAAPAAPDSPPLNGAPKQDQTGTATCRADMPFPLASVHRVLYAWPAVVAAHTLAMGVHPDATWSNCIVDLGSSTERALLGLGCHPLSSCDPGDAPWPELPAGGTSLASSGAPPVPLPLAVAVNCALLSLWSYLRQGRQGTGLASCLGWLRSLHPGAGSSALRAAAAWVAFQAAFLDVLPAWLDSAARGPGAGAPRAEVDAAISLLGEAAESPSDAAPWADAVFGEGSAAPAALGPASPE